MNQPHAWWSSQLVGAIRRGQQKPHVILSRGENVRFGVLYFVLYFFVYKTRVVEWLF